MLAATLLMITLATVEGKVTTEDGPLPGTTVTVSSRAATRTQTTDAEGRYRFEHVPEGEYDITFELVGFVTASYRLLVSGEIVRVADQDLQFDTTKVFILACGRMCEDERPASRYDLPLCSDYAMNDLLFEAAERGDASAISLLEKRHASEVSGYERTRIGVKLLGKSGREPEIWNEIEALAEIVLRFPNDAVEPSAEFAQWCDARGVDPLKQWGLSYDALWAAGKHPRSRGLLRRALETNNDTLITDAIQNLGFQRDLSSLPLIDKALQRMGDQAPSIAESLAYFGDPRADALAEKYLAADLLASYRELSAAIAAERP